MRVCDVCGMPLPPQTGRGGRRKRHPECAQRRRGAGTAEIGLLPKENPASTREAVAEELEAAGLMARPEALAALSLASRLDAGDEPGAAHAALSKELRAVLAELRRTQSAKSGLFDQLAEKRAANERAAGGA